MISILLLKMATVKCHVGLIGSDLWIGGRGREVLSSSCICYHPQSSGTEAGGTPVYGVHFLHPLGPNMRVIEGQVCV